MNSIVKNNNYKLLLLVTKKRTNQTKGGHNKQYINNVETLHNKVNNMNMNVDIINLIESNPITKF